MFNTGQTSVHMNDMILYIISGMYREVRKQIEEIKYTFVYL